MVSELKLIEIQAQDWCYHAEGAQSILFYPQDSQHKAFQGFLLRINKHMFLTDEEGDEKTTDLLLESSAETETELDYSEAYTRGIAQLLFQQTDSEQRVQLTTITMLNLLISSEHSRLDKRKKIFSMNHLKTLHLSPPPPPPHEPSVDKMKDTPTSPQRLWPAQLVRDITYVVKDRGKESSRDNIAFTVEVVLNCDITLGTLATLITLIALMIYIVYVYM